MSWVSTMGRRFLQAYSEGLVMTCPMHRASDTDTTGGLNAAAIDQPQDNLHAALRREVAGSYQAQAFSSVRH
jgi:hypothetical protein